jgi:hypothetical protein
MRSVEKGRGLMGDVYGMLDGWTLEIKGRARPSCASNNGLLILLRFG